MALKTHRQGNDFKLTLQVYRLNNAVSITTDVVPDGAIPEDLTNAQNIKLSLYCSTGACTVLKKTVNVNEIVAEIPISIQDIGTYYVILEYDVVDISFADGLKRITVDFDAFKIVCKSAYADTEGDVSLIGVIKVGLDGKSAYQYAQEHGYTGTEEEFGQLQYEATLAAINEAERVIAESNREETFNTQMDAIDGAIGLAGIATDNANNAATNANDKAVLADNSATNANSKAQLADTAASNANIATGLANTATQNANLSASNANDKASLAQTAADNANTKANLADQKATLANNAANTANTATTNANTATTNANNAAAAANGQAGAYNVTVAVPLPVGNYYTSTTARVAVPANVRLLGRTITYATASGVWYSERYIGTDVANWTTSANWERVPDNSQLIQLGADLNIVDSVIYPDVETIPITTSKMLLKSGILSAGGDANWIATDYIPLNDARYFEVTLKGSSAMGTIAFYDSSKNVLPDLSVLGIDTSYTNSKIEVPTGASYVAFGGKSATFGSYTPSIVKYKSTSIVDKLNATNVEVANKATKDDLEVIDNAVENMLLHNTTFSAGKMINISGVLVAADANWIYSELIDINVYPQTILTLKGSSAICTVAYYDANYNFMPSISVLSQNVSYTNLKMAFNATARYVRLSGMSATFGSYTPSIVLIAASNLAEQIISLNTNISSLRGVIKPEYVKVKNPKKVELKVGLSPKIFLFGDSISSINYKGYKYYLSDLMGISCNQYDAKTGVADATELADAIVRAGHPGWSTAALAVDSILNEVFNYEPDLIIIEVGGNDKGTVVGTFGEQENEKLVSETDISLSYNQTTGSTLIQALDHIVRKIKYHYYDVVARANLTGSETMAEKIAKIDAVKKPYIAVITTLPQKRDSDAEDWSKEANWIRKRNAVVEVCNKNNIHCIDTCSLWGVDMSKEPYYNTAAGTDIVNQTGIYTMDGLHPSNAGYERVAQVIAGEIVIKHAM